jgi:ABC-type glycerol-3-phosphate transport system permease component
LKGFFDQLPKEIEEAAIMDGCGRIGIFYRMVLPISKPGIASVSLLSAVFVWNDYLVSSSFVSRESLRMLSTGIYNYVTAYGVLWGQLMSGVCIAIIPIVILFVCLQKQFIAGLSAGAVKG